MGLPSLKKKIGDALSAGEWSEAAVVYVLVEMGKYIERSGPKKAGLRDRNDIVLKEGDYTTVRFFRDWVAHTEKERNNIPQNISALLRQVLNGGDPQQVEGELFKLLSGEVHEFSEAIFGRGVEVKLEGFFENLRTILAEQFVTVHPERRLVGYDDSLILRERK